jgi:hypothetical protein
MRMDTGSNPAHTTRQPSGGVEIVQACHSAKPNRLFDSPENHNDNYIAIDSIVIDNIARDSIGTVVVFRFSGPVTMMALIPREGCICTCPQETEGQPETLAITLSIRESQDFLLTPFHIMHALLVDHGQRIVIKMHEEYRRFNVIESNGKLSTISLQ